MPKRLPLLDLSTPVCCPPVAAVLADQDVALQIALRLKALADPARVRLISLLLCAPDGSRTTGELAEAVDLSEPTVSHHLGQLRKAGLITSERRGMSVHHSPCCPALSALCTALDPTCCQ